MRKSRLTAGVLLIAVVAFAAGFAANKPKEIKRVGMVVGIDPDQIDEYKRLHADGNPGVRDLLNKYHMHNFSIFLQQMPDGKWYEFGYYEYTGDDFEGDMAKMDAEPRTIEWLKVCDPMQIPLPEADGWTEMERVYFNP
jgi:L-rhamnose mutarotase